MRSKFGQSSSAIAIQPRIYGAAKVTRASLPSPIRFKRAEMPPALVGKHLQLRPHQEATRHRTALASMTLCHPQVLHVYFMHAGREFKSRRSGIFHAVIAASKGVPTSLPPFKYTAILTPSFYVCVTSGDERNKKKLEDNSPATQHPSNIRVSAIPIHRQPHIVVHTRQRPLPPSPHLKIARHPGKVHVPG